MSGIVYQQQYDYEVENASYLATAITILLQSRTPVLSGKLRESWIVTLDSSPNQTILTILNQIEYASFIESGTRRIAAREMLSGCIDFINELVASHKTFKLTKPLKGKWKQKPNALPYAINHPSNLPIHAIASTPLSKFPVRARAMPIVTPPKHPLNTTLPTKASLKGYTNKFLRMRGAI